MNTDKTISVEASLDGKRNAFHHRCNAVGHSRPYAVCLNLCAKRKKGALSTSYSECSAIIGKKECPALRMRKEEIAAGYAIYFIERITVSQGFVERAKEFVGRVVSAVVPAAPAKPNPVTLKKSSSIIDRIDDTNYTKVITTAVKPADVPKVEPKQGESLLEMARRLMAK